MKTASAKNKGRMLQKWACDQVARITGLPCGRDQPIESRGMGQSGCDVRLDELAKKLFPFSIECKNCEKWNVHEWVQQAKEERQIGTDWLLICKRNNHQPLVIMDAARFFDIMKNTIRR